MLILEQLRAWVYASNGSRAWLKLDDAVKKGVWEGHPSKDLMDRVDKFNFRSASLGCSAPRLLSTPRQLEYRSISHSPIRSAPV
jgi:hypothetical protein